MIASCIFCESARLVERLEHAYSFCLFENEEVNADRKSGASEPIMYVLPNHETLSPRRAKCLRPAQLHGLIQPENEEAKKEEYNERNLEHHAIKDLAVPLCRLRTARISRSETNNNGNGNISKCDTQLTAAHGIDHVNTNIRLHHPCSKARQHVNTLTAFRCPHRLLNLRACPVPCEFGAARVRKRLPGLAMVNHWQNTYRKLLIHGSNTGQPLVNHW